MRKGQTQDQSRSGSSNSGGEKSQDRSKMSNLSILTLAALGVVYGDIGTSPLYALRECFKGKYGIAASSANVLGVLSLMFWALIMIVTIKYMIFVLRADNHGEGGILALTALVTVSYTHLRAHETDSYLVCRLLLEKKKK